MPTKTTAKQLLRAADRKAAADDDYLDALLTAVNELGYAEVARLLETSRQAVRQLVLRASR